MQIRNDVKLSGKLIALYYIWEILRSEYPVVGWNISKAKKKNTKDRMQDRIRWIYMDTVHLKKSKFKKLFSVVLFSDW